MKTQNDIKITVIPPMLEEDKVYVQPIEKDADCILGDFLDENQLDGFSIFEEDIDGEYEREAEECARFLEQLRGGV